MKKLHYKNIIFLSDYKYKVLKDIYSLINMPQHYQNEHPSPNAFSRTPATIMGMVIIIILFLVIMGLFIDWDKSNESKSIDAIVGMSGAIVGIALTLGSITIHNNWPPPSHY